MQLCAAFEVDSLLTVWQPPLSSSLARRIHQEQTSLCFVLRKTQSAEKKKTPTHLEAHGTGSRRKQIAYKR